MSVYRVYIKRHWKQFMAAILFLVLEASVDLLQPTLLARIIDVGVAGNDMDYVLRMGAIMLLITAVGAAGAMTRNIISSRVSMKFGAELRGDLYRNIQSFSADNVNRFERASLITRLTSDVTMVQNFVNGMMRIFVKAPILAVGSLIMAIRLDPGLSIILAVVVPIVSVCIILNMKLGFPRFLKVQQSLDRVNRSIREYLSGVRVVKAFNRFGYEETKFQDANEEFQERSARALRLMAVFNPIIMLAVNFGIIAVIWVGGIRVDGGSLQVGTIIAFINYMTQILFSLMMISMVFQMFIRAKASSQRIAEVLVQKNAMTWREQSEEVRPGALGRVEFDRVSYSYEGSGGHPSVRELSFACKPGELIGIIGSTGSGKSTLVGLIPRFYDPDSGSVKLDGFDIRECDPSLVRQSIAYVPQKSVLFTGTIAENIRMGNEEATEEELAQAAKLAQAHDFIAAMPEGYVTRLGQRGVNVSGGQKQRISIARALVRKPSILILDDCTSAVDVETEARLKQALRTFTRGMTCFLIAQRITSVMDADQIIVLDEGEIVGIGTHSHLLEQCRVYREIYRSQVGEEVQVDGRVG